MLRIFLIVTLVSVSYAYYLPRVPHGILLDRIPSTGRIIEGTETTIQDVPYQIALLYMDNLMCGGSIVTPKAVVSAAHCTNGKSSSYVSIRTGSSFHNSGGQVIASKSVFRHELYKSSTADYDISIIELSSDIVFSASAAAIALPVQGLVVPEGSIAQTSGWGYISEASGGMSLVLHKVEILISDQVLCNKVYNNLITPRMICAGLDDGGKGPCSGDYGGPLVVDNTLVGIGSWAQGCARPGYPGVFARVSELRNWIDGKLYQIV